MLRRTPLKRGNSTLKRTRLSPVSKKRKKEMGEYAKLRAEFLRAHPYCMVWLRENGFTEDRVSPTGKVWSLFGPLEMWYAPRSTEIHHGARRGKNYLNTKTWWAVCRESHDRIEQNPSWARANGYLTR